MRKNQSQCQFLKAMSALHTRWVTSCYRVIRQGRKRRYEKSGATIDPAEWFQVMDLLNVKNGTGKIELARLNLTDGITNQLALIWVGDINV